MCNWHHFFVCVTLLTLSFVFIARWEDKRENKSRAEHSEECDKVTAGTANFIDFLSVFRLSVVFKKELSSIAKKTSSH